MGRVCGVTIRAKILLGCLSLTLVTVLLGLLAWGAQRELGGIALRLFDEAFMSMSYLRSAQNSLVSVARDIEAATRVATAEGNEAGSKATAELAARLATSADDLEIARDRAMSPEGKEAAEHLRAALVAVSAELERTGSLPPRERIAASERGFDEAVEIFAGDGYRSRRAIVSLVGETTTRTFAGVAVSVVVALGITLLLSNAIVPSVRHAVRIATSIAAGRLDNDVGEKRRSSRRLVDRRQHDGERRNDARRLSDKSETGLLLQSLGVMQASIAEKMAQIEALMAAQASNHATEIGVQHARFEAAVENMTQGLCLLDADGLVVMHNRRFAEMFGTAAVGVSLRDCLPEPLLVEAAPGQAREKQAFTRALRDERSIAVSEEPLAGGGWVATYDDVSDRLRTQARLEHVARHDGLTGLPNRLALREQLAEALTHIRSGDEIAVLCIGLDHFKSVNDALGHAAGDGLLRAVAGRLRGAVEAPDLVVRLGGDEFAVVHAAEGTTDAARGLAERLVDAVAGTFEVDGHRIDAEVSIGVAVASEAPATAEGLIGGATIALHRAKAEGRGRYRFFDAEMDARAQARRSLEVDLRRAVAEQEFEVHYQPLVCTETRVVAGFEALARWKDPVRGMVSPGVFIPLAEEIGLIGAIGGWVLNRACADAMTWPDHVKVAVNLSPLQFKDRGLAGQVAAALAVAGLPASRLELEITESLLMDDEAGTMATLHSIKELGVQMSMDDFGTGYSSLSTLRRFPFDKIKIDQSFVRNLGEGDDCLAIVRAVVGLGHSLGMRVLAEGVETEEQLALLRREGCREVQGYLFSPPRPLAVAAALIGRHLAEAA